MRGNARKIKDLQLTPLTDSYVCWQYAQKNAVNSLKQQWIINRRVSWEFSAHLWDRSGCENWKRMKGDRKAQMKLNFIQENFHSIVLKKKFGGRYSSEETLTKLIPHCRRLLNPAVESSSVQNALKQPGNQRWRQWAISMQLKQSRHCKAEHFTSAFVHILKESATKMRRIQIPA